MIKKIILISLFFFVNLGFALSQVNTVDMQDEEENDSLAQIEGRKWARFLSDENQKRFFGDGNYKGSSTDLMIVGKVVNVELTPNDDFYFSKFSVSVEEVVYERKDKKVQKGDILTIKHTTGPTSPERIRRSIRFNELRDTTAGIFGASDEEMPEKMLSKEYIFKLTRIPWQVHFFYGPEGFREKYSVIDSTAFPKYQICGNYYEILLGGMNEVKNGKVRFYFSDENRSKEISVKEAVNKIRKSILEIKREGCMK
jgi:hypothetical protein